MAQADYNIAANPSGLNLRTEANAIFSAILSNNSGSVAPTVTTAFMMWVDTSNATYYYLKMRNHDNTAWVTLFTYTVSTKVIEAYTENTVKLTESQSVGGVKTFTSSPIVPTPTTGTQAVNKDYADLKVALASFVGTNQSLSSNGYQKLPGGLIIQWGTTSLNSGGTVLLPIVFPNTGSAFVNHSGTVLFLKNISVVDKGYVKIDHNYSSATYFNYVAIGY